MTDEGTHINGRYLPSIVELERRRRIRLSVFAYAYEFENESLISDAEYDRLSRLIKKDMETGHALDLFFKESFEPDTGMWIRKHPYINEVKSCYEKHYRVKMK